MALLAPKPADELTAYDAQRLAYLESVVAHLEAADFAEDPYAPDKRLPSWVHVSRRCMVVLTTLMLNEATRVTVRAYTTPGSRMPAWTASLVQAPLDLIDQCVTTALAVDNDHGRWTLGPWNVDGNPYEPGVRRSRLVHHDGVVCAYLEGVTGNAECTAYGYGITGRHEVGSATFPNDADALVAIAELRPPGT